MFNNRKYINELIKENEILKNKNKYTKEYLESWRKSYQVMVVKNKKLQADIESKENRICNLIEENKELSQHNNFLENQKMQMNKEGVTLIEEMKTNFDIVAKEPKEEVTVSEIEEEFHRVCKFNESGYTCEKCKFKGNNDSGCIPSIILSNYNVTRKESK